MLNQILLDETILVLFIYAMSDNFEKYKDTINSIYRQAKDDLWTTQFATLVLLLFAILFITVVLNLVFFSFGSWFVSVIVYFVEAIVPVVVLFFHQRKVYETVREKALELDSVNPGIYDAYQEWRSKVDSPSL